MKVLVTGGMGFIGSHIVQSLMNKGHDVRLLLDGREAAIEYYENLGGAVPEVFEGDLRDKALTRHALADCQAVVHAAALGANEASSEAEKYSYNLEATQNVLAEAFELGHEMAVYISDIELILNQDAKEVVAGAPLVASKKPYLKSRAEAEEYVRSLFKSGKPVATIYPSRVIGPDDSERSVVSQFVIDSLENEFGLITEEGVETGIQHIDVRDIADFTVALLENKKTGGQVLPGQYLIWSQLANVIEAASGSKLRRKTVAGKKIRRNEKISGVVGRFKRSSGTKAEEVFNDGVPWPNIKNTAVLRELNVELRSPKVSVADALLSLRKRQLIRPGLCPKIDARLDR